MLNSFPAHQVPVIGPLSLLPILLVQRLYIPDTLRILIDTPIRAKEAHSRNRRNRLRSPFLRVLEALVNELLRLDVACEVVANEVVVAVLDDAVDQRGERRCVAEGAALDRVEDGGKLWVEVVVAVNVRVPEVIDVLGQVAEEEDVVLANLASDFYLTGC